VEKMKLIRELNEDIEYLKEEKEGKTTLFIHGPFAQADVANRNKRIYRMPILENEINRFLKESVQPKRAFGELGHPSGPNINLDRTCILTTELIKEGNNFIGKAKVTSTPMGQIVAGLINDGARLGVSTRALGSVKAMKDGINEVQDDLRLLAIDVVADPSAPDAFVDGIMEGREYIYDLGLGEWVENTRKELKKQSIPVIKKNSRQIFEQFASLVAEIQRKHH